VTEYIQGANWVSFCDERIMPSKSTSGERKEHCMIYNTEDLMPHMRGYCSSVTQR
jgi:hypothetical protein